MSLEVEGPDISIHVDFFFFLQIRKCQTYFKIKAKGCYFTHQFINNLTAGSHFTVYLHNLFLCEYLPTSKLHLFSLFSEKHLRRWKLSVSQATFQSNVKFLIQPVKTTNNHVNASKCVVFFSPNREKKKLICFILIVKI